VKYGSVALFAGGVLCALGALGARAAAQAAPSRPTAGWQVYGAHAAGDRYSELTQISRANVAGLREAWRFTLDEPGDPETNPLIVGRTLYAYTPSLKVIALDGASGKLRWTFDPGVHGTGPSRGLAYWRAGKAQRLFAGVMNRLFALDPATGEPIKSFGEDGAVDLRKGLRGDYSQHYVSLT